MSTSDPSSDLPSPAQLASLWRHGLLAAIVDADGLFEHVSPAWTDLTGWTGDQLRGCAWRDFVHPEDVAATEAAVDGHLVDGSCPDLEFRFRGADGIYRWLRTSTAVVDEDGRGLAIVQDVTDRHAADERLARSLAELHAVGAELRRSNEELEQFAYVASHDLHEPLRKIRSFAELLLTRYGDQLDERGHEYLQSSADAADRMQQMLDALLGYARAGAASPAPAVVDLERVVAEARSNLSQLVADVGGAITVDELPTVEGDEIRLVQLLQNVLANGLKYHRPGVAPVLRVTATASPDRCHLEVSDNGIGIPADQLDHVFEVFARLHERDQFEGSGIGLAVSRRIVEGHGGRIWAESTVGHGTTIHIELPREDTRRSEAASERKGTSG